MEAALCEVRLRALAVKHLFLCHPLIPCDLQLKKKDLWMPLDKDCVRLMQLPRGERRSARTPQLRPLTFALFPLLPSFLLQLLWQTGSHCREFRAFCSCRTVAAATKHCKFQRSMFGLQQVKKKKTASEYDVQFFSRAAFGFYVSWSVLFFSAFP